MKTVKNDKVYKLNVIQLPDYCYINWDEEYNYHSIKNLLLNGVKPEITHKKYWYKINGTLKTLQRVGSDIRTNRRHELKEGYPPSELTPKIIELSSLYDTKYDAVNGLYNYKYDIVEGELEPLKFELNIIAVRDKSFEIHDNEINGSKVSYGLLDEIEVNPMLLHEKPCKLSGKRMYDIVREHLKLTVDTKYAELDIGYNWRIKVSKRVKIATPYTTRINVNSGDRRRKARWIETLHNEKLIQVLNFEESSSVKCYPPEMSGKDIYDLQDKLNKYLNDLTEMINTPYKECPHCNGYGVLEVK